MKKILLSLLGIVVVLGVPLYYLKDSFFSTKIVTRSGPSSYIISGWFNQYPTVVSDVIYPHTVDDIRTAISQSKKLGKKLSTMGANHCGAGQNRFPDGVVLNMVEFNKVISFDQAKKTVTVQSGITWEQLQQFLAPKGFALKLVQSMNIFSAGGSLGSNIHGRSTKEPIVMDEVNSFEMVLANGEEIHVDRLNNSELFHSVIGGYGLLGVITTITFNITEDELFVYRFKEMPVEEVSAFVKNNIIGNSNIGFLHIALSLARATYLKTALVKYLEKSDSNDKKYYDFKIQKQGIFSFLADSLITNLSRRYPIFLDLRQYFEKKQQLDLVGTIVSRNNYMGNVVFPKFFLHYSSKEHADFMQEYFVPIDNYASFISDIAAIIKERNLHITTTGTRYVSKNNALLPYTDRDSLSMVLAMDSSNSPKDMQYLEKATQKLIDAVIRHGGNFYLTFSSFLTREQLLKLYPNWNKFLDLKRKYDPNCLFDNLFFRKFEPDFCPQ